MLLLRRSGSAVSSWSILGDMPFYGSPSPSVFHLTTYLMNRLVWLSRCNHTGSNIPENFSQIWKRHEEDICILSWYSSFDLNFLIMCSRQYRTSCGQNQCLHYLGIRSYHSFCIVPVYGKIRSQRVWTPENDLNLVSSGRQR